MANFSLTNCQERITKLMVSIVKYPLELQLIWLADLLCNLMLLKYPTAFKNFKSVEGSNEVSISYRFLIKILGTELKELYLIELLFTFRNTYVHKGADVAKPYFDELLSNKEGLQHLTEYACVTLNFNRIMYNLVKY